MHKSYARNYYWKNRDKILKQIKKRRRNNLSVFRKSGREQQRRFRKNNPNYAKQAGQKTYKKYRKTILENERAKRRKLKLAVLLHYGRKCACCFVDNPEFLHVDHINGKGTKHRQALNLRGTAFYKWLDKHDYPVGYRILCANCNESLGHYGYCPHRSSRKFE